MRGKKRTRGTLRARDTPAHTHTHTHTPSRARSHTHARWYREEGLKLKGTQEERDGEKEENAHEVVRGRGHGGRVPPAPAIASPPRTRESPLLPTRNRPGGRRAGGQRRGRVASASTPTPPAATITAREEAPLHRPGRGRVRLPHAGRGAPFAGWGWGAGGRRVTAATAPSSPGGGGPGRRGGGRGGRACRGGGGSGGSRTGRCAGVASACSGGVAIQGGVGDTARRRGGGGVVVGLREGGKGRESFRAGAGKINK